MSTNPFTATPRLLPGWTVGRAGQPPRHGKPTPPKGLLSIFLVPETLLLPKVLGTGTPGPGALLMCGHDGRTGSRGGFLSGATWGKGEAGCGLSSSLLRSDPGTERRA